MFFIALVPFCKLRFHRKVIRPCSFSLLLSLQLSTFSCLWAVAAGSCLARPIVPPHPCCSCSDISTGVQTAIIFIPSGSVISLLDEKLIFQSFRNLRQKRLIWSSACSLPASLLLFLSQPSYRRLRREDLSPVPGETVSAPKPTQPFCHRVLCSGNPNIFLPDLILLFYLPQGH